MIAFSNLEPWGPLVEEFRSAQICATLANIHRNPKTTPAPWTASDFSLALQRATRPDGATDGPLLMADPKAQADLIRSSFPKGRGSG
jgi:hypothetical protein